MAPKGVRGSPTWQLICRAVGLTMIVVEFVVYMIAAFIDRVNPDRTLSLSFLSIAAVLVGIPSGYRLIFSRDGSTGSR